MTILRLHAYNGPNIHGPAPGVLLRVHCDRDRSERLRAALKDGAQFVGIMLANLIVEAEPSAVGQQITALFGTDAPTLGAELCRYIVAGMNAEAQADDEWDREGPLLALQDRRRAETLPFAALQLMAEARSRGLPSFVCDDGRVQLGYGNRGWSFDPRVLRERDATIPTPPWAELGSIPIVAVTGCQQRKVHVARLADGLVAQGVRPYVLDGAGFAMTRVALADPAAEALVVGLDSGDILRHGLAFDRCDLAVITDQAGVRPAEADDDDEWLRALGIPMLLAPTPVHLNLSDPALQPLVPYAPNGVIGL